MVLILLDISDTVHPVNLYMLLMPLQRLFLIQMIPLEKNVGECLQHHFGIATLFITISPDGVLDVVIYELFGWDLVEEALQDNFDSVFGKPSAFCMGT